MGPEAAGGFMYGIGVPHGRMAAMVTAADAA